MNSITCYLQARDVRQRYGVSDMTLWRWAHDDRMGFPKPLRINGRRFWKATELDDWEAAQAKAHKGA